MPVKGRIRAERRLKAKEIATLPAGAHEDGGGLRLQVEPSGSRRWVLRVTINGQRRYRGLGGWPLISLEAAREAAQDFRRAARLGRDLAREQRQQQARKTTFREAFYVLFELRRQALSNPKHLKQWPATMETYVFPRIGDLPVADVMHADVLAILEPIWFEKPETARRVLQRMELVFKSAILRGQREKASPCIGVAEELGSRRQEAEHYRSLPYAEVPAFIQALRACRSAPIVKLCFEWTILTATRSGEARGAMWSEIEGSRWTIPPPRMKKIKAPHIVPLSARCLEIAAEARALNPTSELLFPGMRPGKPLSDMTLTKLLRDNCYADRTTVHGFRSSFRNWCTEVDKCREVVAESALSHTVRDKTEAAYRRVIYLEERVGLMQRWAAFINEINGR
jgi:integrase